MKKPIYRINEIKLSVGESKSDIPRVIERKLSLKKSEIKDGDWEIRRESIDARDKSNIKLVYTVDFSLGRNIKVNEKLKKSGSIKEISDESLRKIEPGKERLKGRIIISGFGPCGIFAALELAKRGYKPLVIERGAPMSKRVADVDDFNKKGVFNGESNILFGEGGAGTFSDGKLTSGIKDGHIRDVLTTFKEYGADPDVMYKHKPHIGTDVLRRVIVNIRKEIERLGGEVRFGTKLEELIIEEGKLKAIKVNGSMYNTNALILAIGHSARDTFRLLRGHGINMEQKPFSIGVRMEHPQEMIDRAQYGDEKRLPPADYKVSYKATNGRGVYSFCMCPGGEVVTCASEEKMIAVNGMSNRNRDSGTANSGILCDVRTSDFESDDVLAGVAFQEKYESLAFVNGGMNYKPPKCSMIEFLEEKKGGEKVSKSLPPFAYSAIKEAVPFFARKIHGFDDDDAVVTAVETRSSSPIRILRDDGFESNIKGIYPAGEGAGYAGGITSAACDGIKVAERIISIFAAPKE